MFSHRGEDGVQIPDYGVGELLRLGVQLERMFDYGGI